MNKQKRILYLGTGWTWKRARALERLGNKVEYIDMYKSVIWNRITWKWIYLTGGIFLDYYFRNELNKRINSNFYDFIIVDGGELVGPGLMQDLRKISPNIIHYTMDDPFGRRDKNRFRSYLKSVPYYDLLVVMREVNVAEAYSWRAKKVLRVFMSVDELDGPRPLTESDRTRLATDVLFVGTWMPERGPFLAELVRGGLPLALYGNDWHKATEWSVLRGIWRGPAIYGDDYLKALQSAKVSLGLLSKGNRDLHTTRTFEIPYCGGLFCAERTSEHLELYEEGVEAVFWDSAAECIERCGELLADEAKRRLIAAKGRKRCLKNGIFNEKIMAKILEAATC
jgi:spore maturation protein CgeB